MEEKTSELSEREREILRLIATGASNKEIAYKLVISPNTVKVHVRNIFGKIGAASRTEAAMYAVREGLVEGSYLVGGIPTNQNGQTIDITTVHGNGSIESLQQVIGKSSLFSSKHRLTLIGLIFVFLLSLGGIARSIYLQLNPDIQTELLNENRWANLAPLPTVRKGLSLIVFEGIIYAIAGEIENGEVSGIVESYNPKMNIWESKTEKPTPITDARAVILGGKIYVPGGLLENRMPTHITEVYDPRTDSWEDGAQLPISLSGSAVTTFEGKLFLFGGWDGENYRREVFKYDPSTDSWTEQHTMPSPRCFSQAVVSGGKIYLLGGKDERGAMNNVDIYEPELDESGKNPWIEGAEMSEVRYSGSAAVIADIIYYGGGVDSDQSPATLLEYNPLLNSWQAIEMPVDHTWSSLGMVNFGTSLYFVGGQLGESMTAENLSYQAIYTVFMPVQK